MYWSGWLSKSQVIQFSECPYAWYLNKIKRIKPKPVEALENGKAVHEALDFLYSKLDKDAFDSKHEIYECLKTHQDYERFKTQFDNFPEIMEKFTLKRPLFRELAISDQSTKLRAIIDRIDRIQNELYVVEYKWSKKWPWSEFELALYSVLVQKRWGNPIDKGAIVYLTDGDVKILDITPEMKKDAANLVIQTRNEIRKRLDKLDKVDTWVKTAEPSTIEKIECSFEKCPGERCKNCQYREYCGID
ncbi:PD-(D/E)XK nuclease family protein [Candidatus Micrarchaeota archaeon]|nr:PD-(D/E)XK nuclease family protein [Candidatus Micrarchaeota archaeon]